MYLERRELKGLSIHFGGQSYKHLKLINYESRVVITRKLFIYTSLESYFRIAEETL